MSCIVYTYAPHMYLLYLFVQVMRFPVECYACSVSGETRMCVTDVPHFKEIIIMSFLCEECGFRSVEVKGGGAVPDHGTISTLHFTPGTVCSLCYEVCVCLK